MCLQIAVSTPEYAFVASDSRMQTFENGQVVSHQDGIARIRRAPWGWVVGAGLSSAAEIARGSLAGISDPHNQRSTRSAMSRAFRKNIDAIAQTWSPDEALNTWLFAVGPTPRPWASYFNVLGDRLGGGEHVMNICFPPGVPDRVRHSLWEQMSDMVEDAVPLEAAMAGAVIVLTGVGAHSIAVSDDIHIAGIRANGIPFEHRQRIG